MNAQNKKRFGSGASGTAYYCEWRDESDLQAKWTGNNSGLNNNTSKKG